MKMRTIAATFISVGSCAHWNGKPMARYSITRVWKDIQPFPSVVPWFSVVWKSPTIPKNSFILWNIDDTRFDVIISPI
ncbi:hypothetical protein LINPERHAP2_LOCUS15782 [Linum perenne]